MQKGKKEGEEDWAQGQMISCAMEGLVLEKQRVISDSWATWPDDVARF